MAVRQIGVALALAAVFCAGIGAQQRAKGGVPGPLEHRDSSARGREVVTGVYSWEPLTHTEWHTHPGEMIGHVTEGTIVVEQERQSPTTYTVGQTFVVPAGVPHDCVNDSERVARVFVTYVVEKGKALSAPVQGKR